MRLTNNSTLTLRASPPSHRNPLNVFYPQAILTAIGALICAFCSASSEAAAAAAPLSTQTAEEVIIRGPDIVRRPLPGSGPGVPPGLTNPEVISLTRGVTYEDLDLSKPDDVAELEARVKKTAEDVCMELATRYPRNSGQYVFADVDCVKKATDDGMRTVEEIMAALK